MQDFISFPFTVEGVNFVSKVSTESPQLGAVLNAGEAFITMNQEAVLDLIGKPSLMTQAEILEILSVVNEGGTHMFLELAGA